MNAARDGGIAAFGMALGFAAAQMLAPKAAPAKKITPPPNIPVPTPYPVQPPEQSAAPEPPVHPVPVPPPAPEELVKRYGIGDTDRLPGLDELVASADCSTIVVGPLWWERAGQVAGFLLTGGITDALRLRDAVLEQLAPACAYSKGTGAERLRLAVGDKVRELLASVPHSGTSKPPTKPIAS